MRRKKWTGLQLATTTAMLFTAVTVLPVQANTAAAPCYGSNGCRGQSDCQSLRNACRSQNTCRHQGMLYLPPEDCLTAGGDENPPATMQ